MATLRGRDVLRFLFQDCEHLIELRALRSASCAFFPIDDVAGMERFCREHANADLGIFFGVASRDGHGGDLAHCRELPALFVEADRFNPDCLASCPLPPSLVVRSGRPRGAHLYWKLREPLALPDEADAAKRLLRGLAHAFDGDFVAAEPARILRVVGTRNPKYQPAPTVSVSEFRADAIYNPSDFAYWLPDAPMPASSSGSVVGSLAEKLRPGDRNNALYRLIRTLVLRELPPSVIATVARTVNVEHSLVPLDERELQTLITHGLRQPDRPLVRRVSVEIP